MSLFDVRVRIELEIEYTVDAEDEDDACLQAEHMAFTDYEPRCDYGMNVYTMAVTPADDEAA